VEIPQNESTPMCPSSPYGCAKAFATQMVSIYRTTFNLFACSGIMYNHESPRRGENFVTRKICRAAAAIKAGAQRELQLGDTSALRDWGYAPDYVRGMWMALNHPQAQDFVFATGQLHSVQEVVATAFAAVELDWKQFVRQDARMMRPAEPMHLVGNAARAEKTLGWKPRTQFSELITLMTQAELAEMSRSH
jgi:GDPmannose 4,6-dehydratase